MSSRHRRKEATPAKSPLNAETNQTCFQTRVEIKQEFPYCRCWKCNSLDLSSLITLTGTQSVDLKEYEDLCSK